MSAGQRIYLLTEDNASMQIPHLQGESLRDAMEVLTLMKVKVNVQGEGYVAEQLETTENGQRTVHLTLKSAEELLTGSDTPEDEAEPPADNEAGATGEGETEGKADGE